MHNYLPFFVAKKNRLDFCTRLQVYANIKLVVTSMLRLINRCKNNIFNLFFFVNKVKTPNYYK